MFSRSGHARRTLEAIDRAFELEPDDETALATLPWIARAIAFGALFARSSRSGRNSEPSEPRDRRSLAWEPRSPAVSLAVMVRGPACLLPGASLHAVRSP
jgi:hypothetical protein